MDKGIIYYTNNRLEKEILELVQQILLNTGLPIVSVSLKPIDFGENTVLNFEPGYPTMVRQIMTGLEKSKADVVFFCEHDVFYHLSHFDFEPPTKDKFYYNTNNWRWSYPDDLFISYDGLTSLSALCVYRKLALDHYNKRWELMVHRGWQDDYSKEPKWARRMGYEPGTKSKRQEIIRTNGCEYWRSEYPNIDIRHPGTFSRSKCTLGSFKHKPTGWKEITADKIPGWNLNDVKQKNSQ